MGDDQLYVQHILEATQRIERFSGHLTFGEFEQNELVQSGVIRELGIIGEAVKKFSEAFKNSHSSIPWKEISGMRDKLIHDYFEIDVEAVWKTLKEDIPFLKRELQK